jgi:hypothetical protein
MFMPRSGSAETHLLQAMAWIAESSGRRAQY